MPETLYIIDTYAQIFRAFYAIRAEMRSRSGEPANAVFGFAGMLFRLLTEHKPSYVVAALDSDMPTFRDELYDRYKATRQPVPPELQAQIPTIVRLLTAFGIPVLTRPWLEADDIIASVVAQALGHPGARRVAVRIVSRDKDLEQLLCERVSLFDVHTGQETTQRTLWDLKGIRPDQVADYLALTGDLVDNVPGVYGVGPKTATQLLQEFGTLTAIRAGRAGFADRRRAAFDEAEATFPIVCELVRLRCDPSVTVDLEDARVTPFDIDAVIALFRELGFGRYQDQARRLHQDLCAAAPARRPALRQAPAQFAFDFG